MHLPAPRACRSLGTGQPTGHRQVSDSTCDVQVGEEWTSLGMSSLLLLCNKGQFAMYDGSYCQVVSCHVQAFWHSENVLSLPRVVGR